MLLWLTEYLASFVSGFSVFHYLTFRTMVSVMTALGMSLLIGPYVIAKLTDLQIGQTVRDEGPQNITQEQRRVGGPLEVFLAIDCGAERGGVSDDLCAATGGNGLHRAILQKCRYPLGGWRVRHCELSDDRRHEQCGKSH